MTETPNFYEPATPFKYPLLDTDFYADSTEIKRLKHFPHKVVRITEGTYDNRPLGSLKNQLKSTQYEYIEGRKILQRLNDHYHIPVPDFDIVIGSGNDQQVTYYTIVDKISGKDLEYCSIKPREMKHVKKLVDELYGSIAQYLWDTYQEGGWYLSDLVKDDSQLVYGKKKGEKQKRIYFVDIEPRLEYLDLQDSRTHTQVLILAFNWLYEMIKSREYEFGSKLRHARQTLLNFANTVSPFNEYFPDVQMVKEELERGNFLEE
ncbi:MAG: hypothetical protein HYW86_01940 [Candidatus Roizmanbacteria bacterium]|nr:MAG: hypothetical protein HYW86_01940 [Candidatus Roizmanbacteria bacterium]